MADQTRPEIMEVQQRNKAIKKEQQEMGDDICFFARNCSVKNLGLMHDLMKKLKKEVDNDG